jgi:FtsP/CotA-like multicopper oxidase with cupredoxin domain/peroxiredoxin
MMKKPPRIFTLAMAAFALVGVLPLGAQQERLSPDQKAPAVLQRQMAADAAQERLKDAWMKALTDPTPDLLKAEPWRELVQPQILSRDELQQLFSASPDFAEPETIRSVDGVLTTTLVVRYADHQIGPDAVRLRGYNGHLVGPTLRCRPGDLLRITLENQLPAEPYMPGEMNMLHSFNVTNLHTHGLHVSPSGNSDNVLLQVQPQSAQRYEIAIPKDHPCGTFWYHAHQHGSTAAQVGSGMSGALIIEGGLDALDGLRGITDRVLLLQQIPYVLPPNAPAKGVIEAEFADQHFGPGTWDKLGRYTTINGQRMPVIRMRPGAVERWRFIDSAVREVIEPRIVLQERSNPDAPESIPMHEIAVDGLPLGRIAQRDQLDLWPGYRSDVLVKAPEAAAGAQYILYDRRVVDHKDADREDRHYLALISIEGAPQPMPLPDEWPMKKLRPASIKPESVTGRQFASYGIVKQGNDSLAFTVDRKTFGDDEARKLWLGEVHEWTLTSRNPIAHGAAVSHPFHIHVNPFEVFSILNEKGEEQLDIDPKTGLPLPLWRDTVILHENWKVSARTRYEHFDGVFVQHCHILDHEDQGMMELVEISKPPSDTGGHASAGQISVLEQPLRAYEAPLWALPDAKGRKQRLAELLNGPALLVFFEGFSCLRCHEQIQALIRLHDQFQRQGTRIIAISTDTVESLRDTLGGMPCPFPIVADPELRAFRQWGCHTGQEPLHGVFLVDARRSVRWQAISSTPYMNFTRLLREAAPLSPAQQTHTPKRATR